MTLPEEMAIEERLIEPAKVRGEIARRMSPYLYVTVRPKQIGEMEDEGWVLDKRNARTVRMRKPKSHEIAFEDRVWATFAKLDFPLLNKDRAFCIRYGKDQNEVRPVAVFAADDDVILLIECRSIDTVRTSQLRREIESVCEQRQGILQELKREFGSHKVKFVLATRNIGVTALTAGKMKDSDLIHMDEDVIDYYANLADHLGKAARYQLLGNLFAGARIPSMNPEVVAIEAHMGGYKYFSFSIEPERLLKFAYILHRNKANSNLMPTYQRLIKKARLRGVAQFVENGGFFPNSLILSMDAGPRGPKFDPFPRHIGETRAGVLHLPKTYRAAYVIDGQHRLYGYAESARASTDLIPVVAFVKLDRPEQVKLFMQINENQQAVPKNLRNTLNADLLYASDDLREQIKALKLYVAQELGENKASPLFARVLIGENPKTSLRCLTIEAISRGVDRGNFLGSFTKTEVRELGTFYRGSNDATLPPLLEYLMLGLEYFKDGLDSQYRLGSGEGGFVFINTGVESIIRILGDVVDHLVSENAYNPREVSPAQLFADAIPYLDPVIAMLDSMDSAEGLEFRRMYGSGGSTKYWRQLQQAINVVRSDFNPPGLAGYLESEEKQFNEEARDMVAALEEMLKADVRKRLEDEYGAGWQKNGIPRKIFVERGKLAVERNADRETGQELDLWDCLYIMDYEAIITMTQDMWKRLFEKRYTRPGDEKLGGRKAQTKWIQKLNEIRNDVFHGRSVSEDDHNFLVMLTAWLVKDQVDNEL